MRAKPPSTAEPDATTNPDKPAVARGRVKSRRTPELELAFGARIRAARVLAGMSQTELGAAVGISFQQVQKYEKGTDRISASTLQGLANTLGVHPGSFYDDAPVPVGSIPGVKAATKAAEVLQQIRNPRVLRQVLMLAKVLAEEEARGEGLADVKEPTNGSDEAR